MADALEDDYIQSEGEQIESGSDFGYDSQSAEPGPSFQNGKNGRSNVLSKRKKVDDEEDEDDDKGEIGEKERRKRRKEKMKKRDQIKKQKKASANMALQPGALARYPVEMQADHLRQLMRTCKQFSKWSEIEMDEMGIGQSMLIDTSGLNMKREAETLSQFILKAVPKVKEGIAAVKEADVRGQPFILVISGNAQRAADLSRSLRSLNTSWDANERKEKKDDKSKAETNKKNEKHTSSKVAVAKLFARHFKIEEQKTFLQSHICPLAVGTPQRIQDLLANGLNVKQLRYIIIDATWTDQKQRTMLDTIETRQALFSLVTCPEFQAKLHGRNVSGDVKENKKEDKSKRVDRSRIVLF